jgi:tetratricopeptide (TPR) repeat protein
LKRFAESRVAAAVVAVFWAAVAGQLSYTAVQRASMQRAVAGAAGFEAANRVCGADSENAECAARLALAAERFGVEGLDLWDRAVELNRHDAALLIQSALAHESAGDEAKAERLLLEAAERSRTWLPRWSLANYYYRRGRKEEVAKWARLALERGYGDRTPLYGLCRSAGLTEDEILSRVVGARDVAGIEAYLRYVRAEADGETAGALSRAAEMLFEANGRAGVTRTSAEELAQTCETLVRLGEHERAYKIWQRLAERGGLGEVNGRDGGALGDAGFTGRSLAAPAFGWAMATVAGVEILAGSPPGTAKIEMSGGQPESFVVLSQRVRLEGGGRWALRFESAENGDLPADGHFHWALENDGEGGEGAMKGWTGGPEWAGADVGWDVEGGFWRLSLVYRRPMGSARWSGQMRIRNLSLRREETGR